MLFLVGQRASFAEISFINKPEVQRFVDEMAKKYQFDRGYLFALLDKVKVRPAIIQSVKTPLEQKPWSTYKILFVTESRIRDGAKFWKKYATALKKAEEEYNVPASIIVATIGVETKYGKNTGNYRVIDALVNLGFSSSPRANFFKEELKEFLLLAREQQLDPLSVMGSYAGAIGQPQFMPSSYRRYAVSFSGNPSIDLSNNQLDVIGSIANYYHKKGWTNEQPVALPLSLKSNKFQVLMDTNNEQPAFSQLDLAKYGILHNDKFFPNQKVKLIELEGRFGKEYWLGFHNFDVIRRYNPSDLYAMAVYQLSYYITQVKDRG